MFKHFGPHHHPMGRHGHGGGGGFFGRFGRDWSEFFGAGPQRADKGLVRYLVLDAISEKPRHGYELIQALEERSKGSYRPSPGVIYPTLQMLEDMGFVRAVTADTKKTFEITEEGKQDLEANRELVEDFYDRAGENPFERQAGDFHEIRDRIMTLMKTVKRSVWHGRLTPKAMKELLAVLDEANDKIAKIFKSDKEKSS